VLDLVFADIAGLYIATRDFEKANFYADIAIENSPQSFRARWVKGLVLESQRDFQGAVEHLQKAHELSSPKPPMRLSRGTLAQALGKAQHMKEAEFQVQLMLLGVVGQFENRRRCDHLA
jgi:tetratricopeptide (TPR) repeat protein